MARGLISLALLLVATAATPAISLAQSSSFVSADRRIAIDVTQAEKNHILFEMREFLHGLHNISYAMAKQDMKALATTARPMGALLDRIPPSLKERLPEEFTQMAIAFNEALQLLASKAEARAGSGEAGLRETHENIAEVLTYCSGCHDTYRFNVSTKKPRK
jgi:hypothetical protein